MLPLDELAALESQAVEWLKEIKMLEVYTKTRVAKPETLKRWLRLCELHADCLGTISKLWANKFQTNLSNHEKY